MAIRVSGVGTLVAPAHHNASAVENQLDAKGGNHRRLYCRLCFTVPSHRTARGSRTCAPSYVTGAFALVAVGP